jgi:hypothetical protein
MSEVSTDLPDSILPQATERVVRISRAMHHVNKGVQMELSDIALEPDLVDDDRRAKLASFGAELVEHMKEGFGLLKDLAETGGIVLEVDERGFPAGLSVAQSLPQLGVGENGTSPIIELPIDLEPEAEVDLDDPEAPATPPAASESTAKVEQPVDLAKLEIILGAARLNAEDLGLSDPNEAEVLRLLPHLGNKPIAARRFFEGGLFEDKSQAERSKALRTTMAGLITKFETIFGQKAIDRIGQKGGARYVIRLPFTVDNLDVAATEIEAAKTSANGDSGHTAEPAAQVKKKTIPENLTGKTRSPL